MKTSFKLPISSTTDDAATWYRRRTLQSILPKVLAKNHVSIDVDDYANLREATPFRLDHFATFMHRCGLQCFFLSNGNWQLTLSERREKEY
jgi:hypothetical protein